MKRLSVIWLSLVLSLGVTAVQAAEPVDTIEQEPLQPLMLPAPLKLLVEIEKDCRVYINNPKLRAEANIKLYQSRINEFSITQYWEAISAVSKKELLSGCIAETLRGIEAITCLKQKPLWESLSYVYTLMQDFWPQYREYGRLVRVNDREYKALVEHMKYVKFMGKEMSEMEKILNGLLKEFDDAFKDMKERDVEVDACIAEVTSRIWNAESAGK